MKDRCSNKNNKGYKNYGGRGITVCERWLKFENFLEDMGEPSMGFTIERIENNKGYYKENCKWILKKYQSKNRRNTLFIEYKGEKKLLRDFASEYSIPPFTLYARINVLKWSIEKAIETPKNSLRIRKKSDINSEKMPKCVRKMGKRFFARIMINRKCISLGGFKTKEEAVNAYNMALDKYSIGI